ncbi:MAG: glutathione peroxidase [Bacteroides sp.]|nr:glutathione peroxidase [Bacteroides sp.]
MEAGFYRYSARSLQGKEIGMDAYRGKVVLVVNTASRCGLTPQLEGLEALYRKYKDEGLVVLGFPCNQFMRQEPGDENSIAQGCVVNYGVTFQMFSKINVNGEEAHPLYKYLRKELKGNLGSAVKWNFTKFLIDRNGKPVKRFSPVVTPEKIEPYVRELLKAEERK